MTTRCWIITEGMKGTENPCIALAEAAGLAYETKIVKLRQPWKTVTPWITHFVPAALAAGSSDLSGPWPDVIIASGRKAIAPALWIKKQSNNKTKLAIVLSPVVHNKNFDLVVAPKHDLYHGKNVLPITCALSLITSEKLAAAKDEWRDTLDALPSPRVAVLIGGNSRTHQMTQDVVDRLIAQLQGLQASGHSLMITASRRTPDDFVQQMRNALNGHNIHFYDGTGANPYQAYLAWADAILVTEDSFSMPSEAISTGKPIYIIKMAGGSKRFQRFHDNLIQNNYARWFDGQIDHWTYTSPDDLVRAAQRLKSLITS